MRRGAQTGADARLRSDALVSEVLEQFVFDFAFSSSGAATVAVTTTKGAAGEAAQAASSEAFTLDGLRKQACSILRSLIAAISTLNSVPEERVLSIQVRLRWLGASSFLGAPPALLLTRGIIHSSPTTTTWTTPTSRRASWLLARTRWACSRVSRPRCRLAT